MMDRRKKKEEDPKTEGRWARVRAAAQEAAANAEVRGRNQCGVCFLRQASVPRPRQPLGACALGGGRRRLRDSASEHRMAEPDPASFQEKSCDPVLCDAGGDRREKG